MSNTNVHQLIHSLQSRGITLTVKDESVILKPKESVTPEIVATVRERKAEIIARLSVPRLPWQIERLLRAASDGVLNVSLRGVPDATRYVMAWAVSYIIGDREEALRRLWAVYGQWEESKKALN
jgi:TubC N-terminal docking domain